MKIRIQMIIETDDEPSMPPMEMGCLERDQLSPATLGLSLAEARQVLLNLQAHMVDQQIQEATQQAQPCPHCQSLRPRKGLHHLKLRTLFGEQTIASPRFYTCSCDTSSHNTVSPLAQILSERTTPELLYLQTKWAALLPYNVTIQLLEDILPIHVSSTSLKRHVQTVATRCEQELGSEQACFIEGCLHDWEALPEPDGPLIVGLDGGYIHLRDATHRKAGSVEVIVGKSIPYEAPAKCFGFVNGYDPKPRRRVFDTLVSQGLQMNQAVVFLSDGGETVRDLQFYLSPQSEHLLDWFHVTMRLTLMQQLVKGLPQTRGTDNGFPHELDRIKWFLWHGNVFRALQTLDIFEEDLEILKETLSSPHIDKLLKAIREFYGYIHTNRAFIPNYGDRYRHGERISTGFVESTVNQVISKRFVKKQQMRWTKRGIHGLLQVRIKVLNEDWHDTFSRWYPDMPSYDPDNLTDKAIA